MCFHVEIKCTLKLIPICMWEVRPQVILFPQFFFLSSISPPFLFPCFPKFICTLFLELHWLGTSLKWSFCPPGELYSRVIVFWRKFSWMKLEVKLSHSCICGSFSFLLTNIVIEVTFMSCHVSGYLWMSHRALANTFVYLWKSVQ